MPCAPGRDVAFDRGAGRCRSDRGFPQVAGRLLGGDAEGLAAVRDPDRRDDLRPRHRPVEP